MVGVQVSLKFEGCLTEVPIKGIKKQKKPQTPSSVTCLWSVLFLWFWDKTPKQTHHCARHSAVMVLTNVLISCQCHKKMWRHSVTVKKRMGIIIIESTQNSGHDKTQHLPHGHDMGTCHNSPQIALDGKQDKSHKRSSNGGNVRACSVA